MLYLQRSEKIKKSKYKYKELSTQRNNVCIK